MSAPVGRREFFALEAGEYLERLSLLVGGVEPPPPDDLVRYSRALRGAALMAGPPGFSVAASAIETTAKSVRDGGLAWHAGLADRLADALEDCKALLRNVREWGETDAQRCEQIAEHLEAEPGAGRRPGRGHAGTGLTAGVRAYVAREAAAVAGALDQVAEAVEQRPSRDSADQLVHRLQPLRGLGALPGLSPLPELLETLDLSIAASARAGAWSPLAGKAFRATGAALARMARDIAELGIPQHDSSEVVQAAELLKEAFLRDEDVVEIATLFAEADREPIVSRGVPPSPPAPGADPTIELISLSDRLRQAADQTRAHLHRSARSLQIQGLVLALRGLGSSGGVRAATGDLFSRLEREGLSGRGLTEAEVFSGVLRHAADVLADAVQLGSTSGLRDALAPLVAELDRLGGAPEPDVLEIIPIESLAPAADESAGVVPIASLGYSAAGVVPPAYLPFEQTFATYFRLVQDEETAAFGPIVPIEALAPDSVEALVPIQSLLFRGRRALERADLVRRELDAALRIRRDLQSVETLLAELLDLVPLALDDER